MSENNSTRENSNGRASNEEQRSGLLGIGLDARDGQDRVTQGDDFLLVGGSQETHERLQGLVIRMEEKLKRKGKRIRDLEGAEFEDTVRDSME